MKKALFSLVGTASLIYSNSLFAAVIDQHPIDPGIVGNPDSADIAIQKLVGTAAGFLGILAVIYAVWGGFNIMTAGGNDEKVKKGKAIIIQACIGLVIIWLSNSLVQFVLTKILAPSA